MSEINWDSLQLSGSRKVEVYRNYRRRCWSVRSNKTGKVIDHVSQVVLKDCELVVRKSGRDRVLREGVKNVHAFVKGVMVTSDEFEKDESVRIGYEPWVNSSFVVSNVNRPIHCARFVHLDSDGHAFANTFNPRLDRIATRLHKQ